MTNIIARYIALPIVSAGILGGAALGLAGMASAQAQQPTGPGYSYAPAVKAQPARQAAPGKHWHKGTAHLQILQPSALS